MTHIPINSGTPITARIVAESIMLLSVLALLSRIREPHLCRLRYVSKDVSYMLPKVGRWPYMGLFAHEFSPLRYGHRELDGKVHRLNLRTVNCGR